MTAAAALVVPAVALLFLVAGCAYPGGGFSEPLSQKLQWFSFVDGDDIRAECSAGRPGHYRLIYNGSYEEQLRVYEVREVSDGGAQLVAAVQGRADLTQLSSADPLAPWRWTQVETRMWPAAFGELEAALEADGFFGPGPDGLRLDSRGFFWTAVGCRDGEVHFHAWRYPSAAFAALAFPEVLRRFDTTGVAEARPRPLDASDPQPTTTHKGASPVVAFVLTADADGLRGQHSVLPGR